MRRGCAGVRWSLVPARVHVSCVCAMSIVLEPELTNATPKRKNGCTVCSQLTNDPSCELASSRRATGTAGHATADTGQGQRHTYVHRVRQTKGSIVVVVVVIVALSFADDSHVLDLLKVHLRHNLVAEVHKWASSRSAPR